MTFYDNHCHTFLRTPSRDELNHKGHSGCHFAYENEFHYIYPPPGHFMQTMLRLNLPVSDNYSEGLLYMQNVRRTPKTGINLIWVVVFCNKAIS